MGRRMSPPDRPERHWSAVSPTAPVRLSRIAACRNYGALISGCVLRVTRHGLESAVRSGTLCEMRVVPSMRRAGVALEAAPDLAVRALARRARGRSVPACSTPRDKPRTVCRTGTPSRWNMPEALVGVTVRQPCCQLRDSRSVTLAPAIDLTMKPMTRIVALVRRGALRPPIRMV